MINNYVNTVGALYTRALNTTGEERDRRINDLTHYLMENELRQSQDPLLNSSHPFSYRTVRNLSGSAAVNLHLQQRLDAIERAQFESQFNNDVGEYFFYARNYEPFFQWVNRHQTKYTIGAASTVEDVLSAVDEARSILIKKSFLSLNIEGFFSQFIKDRFDLYDYDKIELNLSNLCENRKDQLRLLAHLCSMSIPGKNLSWISVDEMKEFALYFHAVPVFYDISEDLYKRFLKLCKNAKIVTTSPCITSLNSDDLPPHVEELSLKECTCERVSLSLPNLKKFTGLSNRRLISLELDAPQLTEVSIYQNHNLHTLRLNTPNLEVLELERSALSHLTLDTPFLSKLSIKDDTALNALTLVYPESLRSASFEGCTSLQSIVEPGRGLPNCRRLNLYNCPAAVPQVPPTTQVYTGTWENRGSVLSFEVNPKDLAEKPLQVLLDFAKIFEKQNYFPNIVWINPLTEVESKGVDAGGLRRHFVASLTENLAFPLNEEGIPLLEDKLALETYGRLIGFAAESSLLLGSTLPIEFYYRVLSDDDALKEVANGVKASLGSKWEKWKRNPSETDGDFASRVRLFADQVQGKPVTADNLFLLLRFDGFNVEKTKDYFKQFFSEFPLLVDERVFQLKHFHQMMLGSLSLEGRPITIHVKGAGEALPPIHACSGEMEIPTYTDYQTFKNKLMWAFRAHDTFETI